MRNKKMPNILFIGDTHIPYERKGYLDFCLDIKKKYNCTQVYHVGDLVDNHAINYHEKETDAPNVDSELDISKNILKKWIKAFPKMNLCVGNHCALISRKAKTAGLSQRFLKTMNEIYGLPKNWIWSDYFRIGNNIKISHGNGYSGKYAHVTAMTNNRCNIIMGHCHSISSVYWSCTDNDRIFALCTGCGVDDKAVAMRYGKYCARKSIISCGVLLENGTLPLTIPMELE